jgi:hypothetical protein
VTTPPPETSLDALTERARKLDVRADQARLFVADLERWERRHAATAQRWWPAFVAGLGAAAIVAAALFLILRRSAPGDAEPVQIGARVAVIGGPDTRYSVAELGPDRTVLELARGSLTARVYAGDRPHIVVLRGGGVEASGSGTISLAVDARGALVAANAGDARVRRGDDVQAIEAGTTWPDRDVAIGRRAAQTLGAMEVPTVERAIPSDVPVAPIVTVPVPIDVVTDAPPAPPPAPPGPAPTRQVHRDSPHDDTTYTAEPAPAAPPPAVTVTVTVTERWRSARLFRSQGKFDQAIAECITIADANDPTWSPIALVEAARIALGPQAAPEHALGFVDRFARDWPKNGLAAEARDLRCHALVQLGRGAECSAPAR